MSCIPGSFMNVEREASALWLDIIGVSPPTWGRLSSPGWMQTGNSQRISPCDILCYRTIKRWHEHNRKLNQGQPKHAVTQELNWVSFSGWSLNTQRKEGGNPIQLKKMQLKLRSKLCSRNLLLNTWRQVQNGLIQALTSGNRNIVSRENQLFNLRKGKKLCLYFN